MSDSTGVQLQKPNRGWVESEASKQNPISTIETPSISILMRTSYHIRNTTQLEKKDIVWIIEFEIQRIARDQHIPTTWDIIYEIVKQIGSKRIRQTDRQTHEHLTEIIYCVRIFNKINHQLKVHRGRHIYAAKQK